MNVNGGGWKQVSSRFADLKTSNNPRPEKIEKKDPERERQDKALKSLSNVLNQPERYEVPISNNNGVSESNNIDSVSPVNNRLMAGALRECCCCGANAQKKAVENKDNLKVVLPSSPSVSKDVMSEYFKPLQAV